MKEARSYLRETAFAKLFVCLFVLMKALCSCGHIFLQICNFSIVGIGFMTHIKDFVTYPIRIQYVWQYRFAVSQYTALQGTL